MARGSGKGKGRTGGWSQDRSGDGKFSFGKKGKDSVNKKTTSYQSQRAEWHAKSAHRAVEKFKSAKTDADKARYQHIAEYSAMKAKQHSTAVAKLAKRHVEAGSEHHKKLVEGSAAANKVAQDSLAGIKAQTKPKLADKKPEGVPAQVTTSSKKMQKYLDDAKTAATSGNKADELKAEILNQKAMKHAKRVVAHHEKAGTTDHEDYKKAKEVLDKAKRHSTGQKTPAATTKSGEEFQPMSDYAYAKATSAHSKTLTEDQIDSFQSYSGVAYAYINGNQTTNGLRNPPPHAAYEQDIKNMDAAFKNPASRMPQDALLYRAAGDAGFSKMQVGGVFEDKGFVSTSMSKANDFYEEKPVRFHISVKKGHPAIAMGEKLSEAYDEKEILLPRNSKFKITKMEQKEGKLYIHAEALPHE